MWDEEDGFFYDVLRMPDGASVPLRVRSMVGLLPLAATTAFPQEVLSGLDVFRERVVEFNRRHPALTSNIPTMATPGVNNSRLLGLLNEHNLRRMLSRMLDEEEFLSDYGIRSLSRIHLDNPYRFALGKDVSEVKYEPAESSSGMFGGNSNWRGPIWFPVNILLVRGLLGLYGYFGDEFKVECPTGSGRQMNLLEVAAEVSRRLQRIFLRDSDGRRAVFGGVEKFQSDPHWRDYLVFYEFFHGDNGAGIGATHQTGWTGLVANLISLSGAVRETGKLTRSYREEVKED
jgi:hypothetical protein